MFRCSSCGAFNRVQQPSPKGQPGCGRCHQRLDVTGAPQAVHGEALWRTVMTSPVPILLDLWAPWCAPCRAVAPILDAVGLTHAGRLLVLKLDTQEDPQTAGQLGVRGIPTFLVFSGGHEVARTSGLLPRAELEHWVLAAMHAGTGVRAP